MCINEQYACWYYQVLACSLNTNLLIPIMDTIRNCLVLVIGHLCCRVAMHSSLSVSFDYT